MGRIDKLSISSRPELSPRPEGIGAGGRTGLFALVQPVSNHRQLTSLNWLFLSTVRVIFLIGLVLQIFGLHAPLLSLVLRLLRVANRSIRLEHNAAGGHVPLSCISPSNT